MTGGAFKPVMQTRCIHCLREQYALAVAGVSRGELGCSWCGRLSQAMTEEDYRAALRARRVEVAKMLGEKE